MDIESLAWDDIVLLAISDCRYWHGLTGRDTGRGLVQLLRVPPIRHQMETFSALLALCAGNSPVPGEFPSQRPVTRGLDVFFDLRLNKQWSKQSWGWWFETSSHPLWRHCNVAGEYLVFNMACWFVWPLRHLKTWMLPFLFLTTYLNVR